VRAVIESGLIHIFDAYLYREAIKEIPGHYWDQNKKAWLVPENTENIALLKIIGCQFMDEPGVQVNSREYPDIDGWIPAEPIESMPIRAKPYRHQVQAYNFVGQILGLFKRGNDICPARGF